MGQLRSSLLAALLGTTYFADVFYLAFKIPNLFRRLFAEGAMSSVFIPIFNQLNKKKISSEGSHQESISEKDFIALITVSLGGIIFVLVVAMVLLAPFLSEYFFILKNDKDPKKIIELTRLIQVMFPYLGFISFSALCQSVLQSKGRFGVPAFTPILFNLIIISMGVGLLFLPLQYFLDRFRIYYFPDVRFLKTLLLACSVVIGGGVQWFYPWWKVRKLGYHTAFGKSFKILLQYRSHPIFCKFFKLMVPVLFSSGVYQINVFLVDPIAFSIEEGAVALLFYSNRLLELPLGIIGVAVTTVSLPLLSKYAFYTSVEEKQKFDDIFFGAVRLLFFWISPLLIISILFRAEIVSLLFKFGQFNQVEKTAECFLFHVLSLPAIFFYRLFYQVFYARNDTRTPLIAAVWGLVVSLILSVVLVKLRKEPSSIALASSMSAYVVMFFLLIKLKKYQFNLLKPMAKYAGFYARMSIIPMLIVVAVKLWSNPWLTSLYLKWKEAIWQTKSLQLLEISLATLLFFSSYFLMLKFIGKSQSTNSD